MVRHGLQCGRSGSRYRDHTDQTPPSPRNCHSFQTAGLDALEHCTEGEREGGREERERERGREGEGEREGGREGGKEGGRDEDGDVVIILRILPNVVSH